MKSYSTASTKNRMGGYSNPRKIGVSPHSGFNSIRELAKHHESIIAQKAVTQENTIKTIPTKKPVSTSIELKNSYTSAEMELLVDKANNGHGEEKKLAIETLKKIIERNNASKRVPKPVTNPEIKEEINEQKEPIVVKPVNDEPVLKPPQRTTTKEMEQSLARNKEPIPPLSQEIMLQVIQQIKDEVYDDEQLNYVEFINCIYEWAYRYRFIPSIKPILNKTVGQKNNTSVFKIPPEYISKFIDVTLSVIFPDKFKH